MRLIGGLTPYEMYDIIVYTVLYTMPLKGQAGSMVRTTVFVSQIQQERLKELASQEGVKPAEIVRRAIDVYMILHGLFGSVKFKQLSELIKVDTV